MRVEDQGSQARRAEVVLQGFPMVGIVDSGADITIMNGALLREVAIAAHLKKKALQPADKVPKTYEHQTFPFDGRLELDISFGGRTMRTPVYIKMNARNPLLLSEGVCRQLGILSYHPEVQPRADRLSPPQEGADSVVPTV